MVEIEGWIQLEIVIVRVWAVVALISGGLYPAGRGGNGWPLVLRSLPLALFPRFVRLIGKAVWRMRLVFVRLVYVCTSWMAAVENSLIQ
jgi:hypothetical protein